ncbi:hypothetical protein CK203_064328 [Vitis vinifera]|uniref:Uncharacterized protein n=1 Tax=Vitis vinifera TaxID=29760 RepID=A0A438G4Y3_VITVI|nr:hypothetical protein CK203_064328 [Vitis vinifera]
MGMQLIWITTSPSSTRHEKALFPYKAKTTAMGGWTSQIGCQYPLEADPQLWVTKSTLDGVKAWREPSAKMTGICNLCSTKQGESRKKMKSCMPKCHQRAPLKAGNPKLVNNLKTY